MDSRQRISLATACCLGLAIPLWMLSVPQLEILPADFQYQADIISYDNFYNPDKQEYEGERRSISDYTFKTLKVEGDTQLIEHAFAVHKVTGENIFSVSRTYAIDRHAMRHVPGAGDRPRDGYLFAPRNLQKGQPFTKWHINYDGPAHMVYSGEETLYGLPVYRYETHFEGVTIEQTKNLTSLPGVGVTKGIRLEPYLQVWVEPVTGMMVKFADDTVAYYTDLRTGEQLYPWNHFRNTFTADSVALHVEEAKQLKILSLMRHIGIPFMLAYLACAAVFFAFCADKILRSAFTVGSIIVLVIWSWWLFVPSANMRDTTHTGPVETIRIGVEGGLLPALVWVADQNGYFQKQGIVLEATVFPSGRAALQAMLQGNDLQMVTVAQTPVVTNSFTRDDFVIVGGMVTASNDVKVLARPDRGIREPGDLKGKTIGITWGSSGHYFLGLFLAQNGLSIQDVRPVDMEASALPEALHAGDVDAIATWEPNVYRARLLLGDAVTLESRGTFREDFYFATFRDWAKDNSDLLKRFFSALHDAETYMEDHPRESQAIIASKLNLDTGFVQAVWPDFSYRLFLDQAVLLNIEQQSRWMVTNALIKGSPPENYLDYINADALESVLPSAVTLIR